MMQGFNRKNHVLLIIFGIILCGFFFFNLNKSRFSISILENFQSENSQYKTNCINLFRKLRNPDPKLVFRPPLKMPPPEMLNDFTQDGAFPIRKSFYFDDAYKDSLTNKVDSGSKPIISINEFDDLLNKIRKNENFNYYDDMALKELMFKNVDQLKNKSFAVFGTILPWVEAIAYEVGSSKISTLDYTRKTYADDHQSRLEWLHVFDFLDDAIINERIQSYDNAASFSSFEHSGLGRYGDPLNAFGDVEAVQQVHCMLKPGGLFFLGLPTSSDGSSYIEFNAHRVYGTSRLALLFKNWELIEKKPSPFHTVFVLKKI